MNGAERITNQVLVLELDFGLLGLLVGGLGVR